MGRLHEIRLKSDQFIAQIDLHIAESVRMSDVELTDMNKKQMLSNVDSDNNPLIHKQTGSNLLSTSYAKRKGKTKPNLFDSGDFQKNMFIDVNENTQNYFIVSDDWKSGILTENYGDKIFGIYDKEKAKEITSKNFHKLYLENVLR